MYGTLILAPSEMAQRTQTVIGHFIKPILCILKIIEMDEYTYKTKPMCCENESTVKRFYSTFAKLFKHIVTKIVCACVY